MKPELLSRIDGARLTPVDIRMISFAQYQTPERVQLISDNSLSFAALDLVELTAEERILLSKRLRLMFTRVASQAGLRVKSGDLDMFQEGETNVIEHETSHFRAIQEIRPEVAAHASINFLPVVENRQILVGTNTMVPAPEVPYTFDETTQIWLAPQIPSGPDYHYLQSFIAANRANLTREKIDSLIIDVENGRRTEPRDHFLGFLKGQL